jgi:hypothetical protein
VDPIQGGTPNSYAYPSDPVNDFDLTGTIALQGFGGWNTASAQVNYKVAKATCGGWQAVLCVIPGGGEFKGISVGEGIYKSSRVGVKSALFGSKELNGGVRASGKLNSNNYLRFGWGQGAKGTKDKVFRVAIGAGKGVKGAASKLLHVHVNILRYRR